MLVRRRRKKKRIPKVALIMGAIAALIILGFFIKLFGDALMTQG